MLLQGHNIEGLCPHCQRLLKFCCSIFTDHTYWNDYGKSAIHFRARLICLNKAFPAIGMVNEYRPIICLSSIAKFFESSLIPKLNKYMVERMIKDQIGFVPEMECGVNVMRMANYCYYFAHNRRVKDMKSSSAVFFIDFSSAYDMVIREKLYVLIEKEKILTKEELQILKYFHSRIEVK